MTVSKKWVMAICWIVIMCLTGPMELAAEPIQPWEYMIGYHNSETGESDTAYVEGKQPIYVSATAATQAVLEVVTLINAKRRLARRVRLIISPVLNRVAQAHSEYMRDRNCFAHQCPGEFSPARRACIAGYRSYRSADFNSELIGLSSGGPPPNKGACFVAEVIAAGYPSPKSVVNAWMKSPGHRNIIMHPQLREIGVGVAYGGFYRRYWTADLGIQPKKISVSINNDDPATIDRLVTLSLTNEDMPRWGEDAAQFEEIMISNNPDFMDAYWEPYISQKTWMLTGDKGPKTVYVKFRDPDGNETLTGDIIFLK